MSIRKQGQCVCGAVSYTVIAQPKRITICHCKWCQRRTGSGFGVEVVFDKSHVQINDDAVTRYRHISDESGRWLDQHFCSHCGSNIGFTLEAVPGIRTLAAGTFDDQTWLSSDKVERKYVYTSSAQDWADIPDNVDRYEKHFR